MIPQLVTIRYQARLHKKHHRYWIPLLPFYLLLTPFLPLILIGLVIACARYRINPIRVIVTLTQTLAGLGGITVDIHQGTATVQVKLI
jgi:hypothetical protein